MKNEKIFLPTLDLEYKCKDVEDLAPLPNIADYMSDEDCRKVGAWALEGYLTDKTSRSKWEDWYAEAIKLALQVKEAKSFPWANCSNVKFPLLTIASLNAHAQAYPALISGDNVVKSRVIGADENGEKQKRADRVGRHMSYQLLETMPWEEQTDKQILVHYIMGTTFKKTYRDNTRKQNCSDFVMPQHMIVNYFAKDMETAPRASHWFPLTKGEMMESFNAQIYRTPDETIQNAERPTGPLEAAKDKSQLLQAPPNLGLVNYLVEQSCWMDLDQDGYDEPYAVTFDEQTGYVYRIHARFLRRDIKRDAKGTVLRIQAENYYTKYTLIPSPDGGFYGLGLGRFLAPINDAVDTVINQMIDNNTARMLGGGFLGRGVRIKAGDTTFKPYEWKTVDSTGDDLRKNIVPNQTPDVPATAFELLKYLVEYGERIGSSGDIQMGQLPGQNTKAETAAIANENGKLIFKATFKRFWRSMKEEFKKIYNLNALYQPNEEFDLGGQHFRIEKEDYNYPSAGIVPAADPNIVSKTDKRATADMLLQTAASVGWAGHDMEAIIRRKYAAYEIQDIDVIFPGVKARPPQPNPKQVEAEIKAQREQTRRMQVQAVSQLAAAKLMMQVKESHAKILKMAAETAAIMKETNNIDVDNKIRMLEIGIKAEEERRDDALETIKLLMDSLAQGNEHDNSAGMGGMDQASSNGGVSPAPKTHAASVA